MGFRDVTEFLLYDWLHVDELAKRPRFAAHGRETFDAVLNMCEKLAAEKFAPFNRRTDTEEPHFDGESVRLPQTTHEAVVAYAESGMLAAAQDEAHGGMQLPYVVEMAANCFFSKASIAVSSSAMLTVGNANLLMAHGTSLQQQIFALPSFEGRATGTMCLSEPQAGSSLSDIATRATPDGDDFESDPLGPRYRLRGNKMWISNGENELTENIVHLVLAKIPDADGRLAPGIKGISLFVVPKKLIDADGALTGERNDVALAGLNHKLGYRGLPNTLLNFGEGKYPVRGAPGAIGYRVGEAGEGLRCIFHMMNEARIGVGLGAAMLGYAGFEASVDYARNRPQGRLIGAGGKNAAQPQSPTIEHPDVKRMLLAQKSYCEGALALALYCARLVDEVRTGDAEEADDAHVLLELLTPIVKSWPSEWCLEANSLAIQVHGGYGYTRDYPVEQYWRDNRLNMIHEGTHGIQAIDLLGRKLRLNGGKGMELLAARMESTIDRAQADAGLGQFAAALSAALQRVQTTSNAAWGSGDAAKAVANATPLLQAFGHMAVAWIWLEVALAANTKSRAERHASSLLQGQLAGCRYFFRWELPRIEAWLRVVESCDETCSTVDEAWL